jgi:hypothetical protein
MTASMEPRLPLLLLLSSAASAAGDAPLGALYLEYSGCLSTAGVVLPRQYDKLPTGSAVRNVDGSGDEDDGDDDDKRQSVRRK